MTKGWTEERRKAQAERCRANKPSQFSTGPKTETGKARSARNALKHGLRSKEADSIREFLRLNKETMRFYKEYALTSLANELKNCAEKSNDINRDTPSPRDFLRTK